MSRKVHVSYMRTADILLCEMGRACVSALSTCIFDDGQRIEELSSKGTHVSHCVIPMRGSTKADVVFKILYTDGDVPHFWYTSFHKAHAKDHHPMHAAPANKRVVKQETHGNVGVTVSRRELN